jgi:hypothetical protein
MEHEFAITTQAVERYLLNEMSPEERDAFEDHYFACEVCAGDVRAASQFVRTANAVWRDEADSPPKLSLLGWLKIKWLSPALVTVATAAMAVVVYQNAVVIPSMNAPRALPVTTLDLTSRAAAPHLAPGDPLHFYIAPERATNSATLWAELSIDSGGVLRSGPVAGPKPQEPIDVYFPGSFQPGRYVLTIRTLQNGTPGEQVARQTFEIAKDQTK